VNRRKESDRQWHGQSGNKSSTYRSWLMMWNRCRNKKAIDYRYYGGRGIKVAKRWFYYLNFLSDMGEKPKGFTLGRIDESKGYSKSNCEWQSRKTQSQSRRYCVLNMKKVKQARALYEKGWTQKQLAEKFRTGKTTMAYAVAGRTWR